MPQSPATDKPRPPESQTGAFVTALNRKHKLFRQADYLSRAPACLLEIAIRGAAQSVTTSG